jgi:hypothetical protein
MLQRLLTAFALAALATTAVAADEPEWQAIVVRFTIGSDGALHIADQLAVDVPPGVSVLSRDYWRDGEQHVSFDRVSRVDGTTGKLIPLTQGSLDTADHYEPTTWGEIKWSVRDKTDTATSILPAMYVIESTVSDAVIPAWSIPRGRQSYESNSMLADPKVRFRSLLALWREAAEKPRTRYLLNYQYEMPPPSTAGTSIQLQLYWADEWDPVHPITPDTIATKIDRDSYNTSRWRVTHLFEYHGTGFPANIDVRRHGLRIAAIVGFPVAALLLWGLFALREWWRRRRGDGPLTLDDATIRQTIFSEDPDVLAARWNGRARYPAIEPFLRRLERQRKLAITLEQPDTTTETDGADDDDPPLPIVRLRLLVPREQLTPYERAGIDALIPNGREISSADIQNRADLEDFDPSEALYTELQTIAAGSKTMPPAPWYSRGSTFLLFVAGLYVAGMESVVLQREPIVLVAALVFSSMMYSFWPSVAGSLVRKSAKWTLLLLVPVVLATALIFFVPFAAELPPGVYAFGGMSIMLLAACKGIFAASATRGASAGLQDRAGLADAREFLRAQLRGETPHIAEETLPWLDALDLRREVERWQKRTGRNIPPMRPAEEWGGAFFK